MFNAGFEALSLDVSKSRIFSSTTNFCKHISFVILVLLVIGCSTERTIISTSEEIVKSLTDRVFFKDNFEKQSFEISSRIDYSNNDDGTLVLSVKDIREGYLYDVNREEIKKLEKSASPGTSMNRLMFHALLIGIALPFDLMNEKGRQKLFFDYEETVEILKNEKIIGKTDEYVTKTFPGNDVSISINLDGRKIHQLISNEESEASVSLVELLGSENPLPNGELKLSVEADYSDIKSISEIIVPASDIKTVTLKIIGKRAKEAAEKKEKEAQRKRDEKRKANLEKLGIFDLKAVSNGSGFFINHKGHLITNAHVIDKCKAVTFLYDSKESAATVTFVDKMNDLAILKSVKGIKNLFIPMRPNDPKIGERIYAIGFPLSNFLGRTPKVTSGIISSLTGLGGDVSRVQIDAALQSGSSGGPIVDGKGRLVAVSVQKLGKLALAFLKNSGEIPENVNFAVKNLTVKSALKANQIYFSTGEISDLDRAVNSTIHITCWGKKKGENIPDM